jgi:hypothetical protein
MLRYGTLNHTSGWARFRESDEIVIYDNFSSQISALIYRAEATSLDFKQGRVGETIVLYVMYTQLFTEKSGVLWVRSVGEKFCTGLNNL